MLYFAPPVRKYGTMFVFPDQSDPTQFYYLPNSPHIAKTETGDPAIRLLIFRQDLSTLQPGQDDSVAFLSLDVDVSFPDEQVQAVAKQLRSDLNIAADVNLSPIFFRSGTVQFLLLDSATPAPGHEQDPVKPTDFVLSMFAAASPSLYGDNRAIFQAKLPKRGAEAIMASLDGFAPIGVVYQLTFAGIQPAYHIRVTADWHKVYKHFSESEGYNSFFADDETQKAIDDLIDNKVIQIEDVIEGVGEEGAQKDHDSVMADIRHFIMETFFTQTLTKETPAGDATTDQVGTVLQDICSAPFSIFGKHVHKLKQMTDDELRTLNIDWSVAKAAERTIWPQAHLSTMFKAAQITKDQLVRIATGGLDEAFRTVSLIVSANCAWDAEKVAAISVEVDYGERSPDLPPTWSFQLTKDNPRFTKEAWFKPDSPQRVTYRYQVVFSPPPEGYAGPTLTLNSGDLQSTGLDPLTIAPMDLYRRIDCNVSTVDKFPFDSVPAVEVHVRFVDEDGSYTNYEDAVLKSGATTFKTTFRARAGSTADPQVQYSYHLLGGQTDVRDWVTMTGGFFVVPNPYPSTLTVVMLAPDPNKYASAVVELEYQDANGVLSNQTFFFDDQNRKTQIWSLPIADPSRRRYRYRLTLTYKNAPAGAASYVTGDWIDTDRPQLPLDEWLLRQLDVQVSIDQHAKGVDHVTVHLQYDDDANNIHQATDGTLVESGDVARLSVVLKDITKSSFTYSVGWVMADGFQHSSAPMTTTKRYLQISGAPPRDT